MILVTRKEKNGGLDDRRWIVNRLSSTSYRKYYIIRRRSIDTIFFFDSFYLTSFAPILLGLDQLSPGLDNVVAGLIDEVLDAVHQLTLPCHIPEEEREKGGRAEERGMSGGEGKRWIASSKVRLHASMFRFARVSMRLRVTYRCAQRAEWCARIRA